MKAPTLLSSRASLMAQLVKKVKVKSLSRVRLFAIMDCSLPGFSIHGIFQARVQEWLPFPSTVDLPDPGSNPNLLHCRQTLYHLSHQGSQRKANQKSSELSPHTSQNGHLRESPTIHVAEGAERRELPCTLGGNVNRYTH